MFPKIQVDIAFPKLLLSSVMPSGEIWVRPDVMATRCTRWLETEAGQVLDATLKTSQHQEICGKQTLHLEVWSLFPLCPASLFLYVPLLLSLSLP